MLKRILSLLFFLTIFLMVCPAQGYGDKTDKSASPQYFNYEVKSKETIFSLCKRFNITQEALVAVNPILEQGLKSGQILRIPQTIASAGKSLVEDTDAPQVEASITTIPSHNQELPRITLLLPFAVNTLAGSTDRYVEFYEGFLLAVDSLKNLGLSFEVQALESGFDATTLNAQLNKLISSDYCIGGINSEQISVLSNWSKKNFKYSILPFSSRIPEMEKNPYLYQVVTPQAHMNERVAQYTSQRVGGSNIIILGANNDLTDPRVQMLQNVKKELASSGISYTEVTDDEDLENLSKVLSTTKLNCIIPAPTTLQETNNLLTRLGAFSKANPSLQLSLMGYPDWIAVGKTYQPYLYVLNTYIYSNFYVDFSQKNVREFQIKFNQAYDKEMLNTYPKYAMMGYDVAAWFIPRMVKEKGGSMPEMPNLESLQNTYQFGTTGLLSGSSNQTIYILHFSPDNEVDVKTIH
jgi:hypothetical protein